VCADNRNTVMSCGMPACAAEATRFKVREFNLDHFVLIRQCNRDNMLQMLVQPKKCVNKVVQAEPDSVVRL
jgi:hypothetical protein